MVMDWFNDNEGLWSMNILCLLGFHKKSSVRVSIFLGTVLTEQHCYRCVKKFNKVNGV